VLGDAWVAHPARRLLDDGLDARVLYDDLYVYGVVHLSKHQCLLSVFEFEIVQQLQPEVFQLVSVVFEQVEVVTHCRQDFIELGVILSVRLGYHSYDSLLLIWIIARHRLRDLINQIVFSGVVRKLVTNGANDSFNTLVKCLDQCITVDFAV